MTDQLALFEPDTEVEHQDAGAPWAADIMWALLPIAEHERTCHLNPNHEATP